MVSSRRTLEAETEEVNAMLGATLSTLISRSDKFYHKGKLRIVFEEWASLIQNKKKFVEILVKGIAKIKCQQGFE